MMYSIDKYLNAPIYNGVVEDEIAPPLSLRRFLGAWYHKVVSSKDNWLGIEAIITLPEFFPDEDRFDMIKHDALNSGFIKRYLDTPSVYLGGSSDYETDIGFAWFHGLVNGKLSDEKITFRPFWRTIYIEDSEMKNVYSGTKINEVDFYYYPGDTVKVHLVCPEIDYLQLRVELLKETEIEKYREIRASLKNLGNSKSILLTDEIIAPGNGIRPSEYKRVNAIDQYSNEGKPTKNTNAKVLECKWESVYLFREINDELIKVPFSEERQTRISCPEEKAFTIDGKGFKEIIKINPSNI